MYREGKAKHYQWKVIDGFLRSKGKTPNEVMDGPARMTLNRKWFSNKRTITLKMGTFREEVTKTVNDPYLLNDILIVQVLCRVTNKDSTYEFDYRFNQSETNESVDYRVLSRNFWSWETTKEA